ncbi:very short patch repair endonuclease [Dyella telluris]|uniref:Very short patch repair endonuclease n=1 Tax=Dyella telluris TaxID=2763498 RepID=A0A7G8Q8R9_9GAMM|nr:very short patch repair endonuclease [Dyella telluris]QNK03177.1 DNA mismatch endonuclease Vsr [Dyella telluris]
MERRRRSQHSRLGKPSESPEELRNRTMRAVHSSGTSTELVVRKKLRELGFTGYRLNREDLPGKPDVVFIGRRKAIFVNGCFWHGHDCKRGSRLPTTNAAYWASKIRRNRERDVEHLCTLADANWKVLTIWECELRDMAKTAAKIAAFMS